MIVLGIDDIIYLNCLLHIALLYHPHRNIQTVQLIYSESYESKVLINGLLLVLSGIIQNSVLSLDQLWLLF